MPPIQQFQLIQRTLHEAELLLRTARPLLADEEALVRSWVDMAIGFSFQLKVTYVDEIPRGRTGKYEDIRCDVVQGGFTPD